VNENENNHSAYSTHGSHSGHGGYGGHGGHGGSDERRYANPNRDEADAYEQIDEFDEIKRIFIECITSVESIHKQLLGLAASQEFALSKEFSDKTHRSLQEQMDTLIKMPRYFESQEKLLLSHYDSISRSHKVKDSAIASILSDMAEVLEASDIGKGAHSAGSVGDGAGSGSGAHAGAGASAREGDLKSLEYVIEKLLRG
jgi:hypothetical protein